jgi:hypothetical protein
MTAHFSALAQALQWKKGGRVKLVVWIEVSLKRYSEFTLINHFESNCENAYLSVSIAKRFDEMLDRVTRKKPFSNQVNLYALISFKQILRNGLKKKMADKISFD